MWFEQLTGFKETTGDDVRKSLRHQGDELISAANGRRMRCGSLAIPALAELRSQSESLATGSSPRSSRLGVREVVGDAGSMHLDEANAGALFQAASQFNLLEMVSPEVTPEAGIDRYENDATQGPACAVACGAGTILRNYLVEVNGRIGQTADNQIDCLADIASHLFPDGDAPWDMRNGYAMFNNAGLERLNARLASLSPSETDDVKGGLRIGVQSNAEVTTSATGHTVSQAYCSALPVAYNSAPAAQFEPFARLILEASYEATLHAGVVNAALTGNPIVFLTLVGGGVFGNREPWIFDAIERACLALGHHELDVVIVSYRSPSPAVAELVQRLDR